MAIKHCDKFSKRECQIDMRLTLLLLDIRGRSAFVVVTSSSELLASWILGAWGMVLSVLALRTKSTSLDSWSPVQNYKNKNHKKNTKPKIMKVTIQARAVSVSNFSDFAQYWLTPCIDDNSIYMPVSHNHVEVRCRCLAKSWLIA